jgi:serine/threonine protein kinase
MPFFEHDLFGLTMTKIRFSISEIKIIFKSVVNQLNQLHKFGFVHRDIKSANILLNKQGQVCLSDFGQSISYKSALSSFKCGTAIYRSPEMYLGLLQARKNLEIDTIDPQKADIWSLGCVLAELVLGFPLFMGSQNFYDLFSKYISFFGKNPVFDQFQQFLSPEQFDQVRKSTRHPLKNYLLSNNQKLESSLLDILLKLLNPDPSARLSCQDILDHEFIRSQDEFSADGLTERFRDKIKEFREMGVKKQMTCRNVKRLRVVRNPPIIGRVISSILNNRQL